jgi:hypothetical protein
MWHQKKDYNSVSKFNKTFLGMLILVYVFSAAICSLDLKGVDGHTENAPISDIHCGIDLKNYVPPEDRNSSLVDLTSRWSLLPKTIDPNLPVLSFSIFKVPKPA